MLKTGDKAPDFKGIDQDGNTISLAGYKGKKLVIYFYPKDNTPGCTAEACDFRDNYQKFRALGYEILGVSKDSEKSHRNFIEKHQLPFPLIADTDTHIMQQYDAWGEKSLYGKKYMGTLRKTFVIDQNGFIRDIIEKVDTKNPTAQILK